jgi:hypothetical protein
MSIRNVETLLGLGLKAHQSNDNIDAIYNNMADELATSAIKR